MLFSQHVKPSYFRRRLFLCELFIVSTILHFIVLFFLLVIYSGYRYSTRIVVRHSGAQLLPAYFAQLPAITISQPEEKKEDKKQFVIQKQVAKKISTTLKKEVPPKKLVKRQPAKQSVQAKKQLTQKQEKKEQTKQPQVSQKKQEMEQIQQTKNTIPKSIESKQIENPVLQAVQSTPVSAAQELVSDDKDFDTVHIQQYIQREISCHWAPPIGLSNDLVCHIKIQVGSDGTVADAIIEESSGVLLYDVSARCAAVSLSLPCWAWGKDFIISFRQE